jgi:transcriptional regulator with XRE-family HTH domain
MDLTPIVIPPRSILYHMKPQCIGTPYSECLSGYAARLAQEHFISPYIMMSKVVIPHAGVPHLAYTKGQFRTYSSAINGLGTTSSNLVKFLEAVTLRTDLRFTTMLSWMNVLPKRGLIRQMRAWCSVCYEEWSSSDQIVYDPLIWAITSVKICIKHQQLLRQQCHHCGRQVFHLDVCTKPGYCSRCKGWLGMSAKDADLSASQTFTSDELEWQTWVTDNVGTLIASAPDLPSIPPKSNISSGLSALVNTVSYGRVAEFAELIKIGHPTVYQWLREKQLPKIETILRICKQLGAGPKNLLCSDNPGRPVVCEYGRSITQGYTKNNNTKPMDWSVVESQLTAFLEETPALSLTQVAKRIGRSLGALRKRYPNLCAKIISRFFKYWNSPFDEVDAKKILKAAVKEAPPPSINEVIRRINGRASHKRLQKLFPKEYRQVLKRYLERSKKPFDLEGTKAKLEAVLKESSPRSLREVAQSLGIIRAWLYKKLPYLCKAISARFLIFMKETRKVRKEMIQKEVYRVGKDLHAQGIYPSLQVIKLSITTTTSDSILREPIRSLKLSLGLPLQRTNI